MNDQVKSISSVLTGRECWGYVAGAGSGSAIELLFGRKLRRDKLLKNECLDEVVRKYEAEFSLFVQCTWRLSSDGKIVCTSSSLNTDHGPMIAGLSELKGSRIVSVSESAQFDQAIVFSNGLTLSLFNDYLPASSDDGSYWVTTPDEFISVVDLKLTIENRVG